MLIVVKCYEKLLLFANNESIFKKLDNYASRHKILENTDFSNFKIKNLDCQDRILTGGHPRLILIISHLKL